MLAALVVLSHLEAKEYIRGLYLSPYAAHQERLIRKIEETASRGDLNTIVVDMKDDFGILRYPSQNPIAKSTGAVRPIFDVDSLVCRMHAKKVRVIARLVCFKDDYACNYSDFAVYHSKGGVWVDEGGAHWLNAFNECTWEYLTDIALELEGLGFDEIQLDYVRFPTDGDVANCVFYGIKGRIKEDAIEGFLKLMRSKLKVPLSVDVFGYATWYTLKLEGQELGSISRNVDYVCPMLYPSHFSTDFLKGWQLREFWTYYKSVESAYKLMGETRGVVTYVQGFSWRAPGFGPQYIYNQILGALAAGADGFFIWNASGNYDEAFTALGWGGSSLRRKPFPTIQEDHMRSIPRQSLYEWPQKPRKSSLIRSLILPILRGGSRNDSRPER